MSYKKRVHTPILRQDLKYFIILDLHFILILYIFNLLIVFLRKE